VTSGFSKDHIDAAREAVVRAADAVECIVGDGVTAAMNKYNG
jgi:hypothetical protein